jgi:MFS family permease
VAATPSAESEPKTVSNAVQYQAKTPAMRRYVSFYAIAYFGIALLWGSVLAILLPLQVQGIEFARIFTGADAGVDVQALTNLQSQVAEGTATATGDEQRLLGLLADYNSARAASLALVSSIAAVTALLQPLIGMLSDRTRSRWGRRAPWILAGAIGAAALICVMPIAPSIAAIIIVWSLINIFAGMAQGPLTATVADRVPENKIGSVSGITGLAAYLGAIVGATVAGAIFAAAGLAAYYPIALVLVVSVVLFVIFARDNSSREMYKPRVPFGQVLRSYVAALRAHDFRWAWISKTLLYLGYGIGTVYSVYMLQGYIRPALSITEAAQIAPLLQIAALPGTLVAMAISGRLSDRFGRRKPFVIAAAAIMALGFIAPFVSPTLGAMFVQAIVTGIGYGIFVVVDQALFIDVLPDKDAAARDLAVSNLGQNVGNILAPVIAGAVVAVFAGQYGPVWPLALVIVVIAGLAVIPIKSVR